MKTALELLNDNAEEMRGKFTGQNQYGNAHFEAINNPRPGFERAIVNMLKGWAEYADAHSKQYGDEDGPSLLGNDYVMGPAWGAIGNAIEEFLSGERKRLDGGAVSRFIHELARQHDVKEIEQ